MKVQRLFRYAARALTAGALAGAAAILPASSADAAAVGQTEVQPIPQITTTAPGSPVSYGTAATITFTVTVDGVPLTKRLAQLCWSNTSTRLTCVRTFTSASGTVMVQRPKLTAPLRAQLVLAADATTGAATSATATVLTRSA
jgi:hypothetical protein